MTVTKIAIIFVAVLGKKVFSDFHHRRYCQFFQGQPTLWFTILIFLTRYLHAIITPSLKKCYSYCVFRIYFNMVCQNEYIWHAFCFRKGKKVAQGLQLIV